MTPKRDTKLMTANLDTQAWKPKDGKLKPSDPKSGNKTHDRKFGHTGLETKRWRGRKPHGNLKRYDPEVGQGRGKQIAN